MREATYEANVISYDATTGTILGVIPQLFGLRTLTILPYITRADDIANIIPVAINDRVLVYFQGEDDSPPKWIPKPRDTAGLNNYVLKSGDTMAGSLNVSIPGLAPVRVGAWVQGGIYSGLMDGVSGQYLIMSNGTHTYVSAPAVGGTLNLRPGINDAHGLALLPSGAHTLVGDLAMTGNLTAPGTVGLGATAVTGALSVSGGASLGSGITLTGGGEIVHSTVAGAYMRFWNGGASIGYLQGNAGGMLLNSDSGVLGLAGSSGITLNGLTLSASVIASRVVATDSSGYIFGNYINMTADLGAGWPSVVAGRNGGDNFLRWYNRVGLFQHDGPGTTGSWNNFQMIIHDSSLGTGQVGLVGWCNGNTWAPIWRVNPANGVGERWDSVTSPGAPYARIAAIGYDTISTGREKRDIVALDDAELLDRLGRAQAKRWMPKVGPVQLEPERYAALNERWTAKGKPSLSRRMIPHAEHDCAKHNCGGTADSPCAVTLNHRTGALGLVAEDHYEAFPEHVNIDLGGIPHSIDTSQVAATALGGLGALVRYVRSLEARLVALEGAT